MTFYKAICLLVILKGTLSESIECNTLVQPGAGNGDSCYECGHSNLSNDDIRMPTAYKVNASIGDFPWHAIIFCNRPGDWIQNCGGTLISPQVVMTAASCVTNSEGPVDTELIRVALGKTNSMWNVTDPAEIRQKVRAIHIHPNYKGPRIRHVFNIALLILEKKVSLTKSIMPACLDYENKILPLHQKNDIGYTAGVGDPESCYSCPINNVLQYSREQIMSFSESCYSCPINNVLQYSREQIMSFSECYDTLRTNYNQTRLSLNEDSYCFGNGTVSPITKGNGGDGVTVIHQGVHYVTGIAIGRTWTYKSGTPRFSIGGVTNVTLYMDWIKAKLRI